MVSEMQSVVVFVVVCCLLFVLADSTIMSTRGYYKVEVIDYQESPYRLKVTQAGWRYAYWINCNPREVETYKHSKNLVVDMSLGGLSGHCYYGFVSVVQVYD